MQTAPLDRAASSWLRPEFARLLAILWVVGLALIYLVRCGAWVLPFQLAGQLSLSLSGVHTGPYFRQFWLARAYDFTCVAAIVAAALGLGAVVTDRLVTRRDVLGMLFALATGFWLLAVIILMAGAAAIAEVPYVFLVLLCWLLPAPRKFVRDFYTSTEKLDGWAKLMFACVVIAALLNLAGALAPPFEYDELEYHLGALADYRRAGRIVFLPHNFYSNLPQLTEMLYMLAMTTTSDIAAKLLHWFFGVFGAMAVYGVARRLWSRSVGLTAAALFYCTPFVQDLSETARIDLATAFLATLAFGALVVGSEENEAASEKSWIWLSAFCAGAAVATKWTAIPVVLLPATVMLVVRRRFSSFPVYCFIVAIMIGPWLVKNWLLTGNPVYPLLYGWFPNPHWSAQQAAVFAARHYPTFGWQTVWQFFTPLWNLSFVEAGAAPLLLMTAPLILLLPRVEAMTAKRAGKLFMGAYAGWFCFTFRPWRFLFPAFGVAAVAGAYALEKLGRESAVRIALRWSVGVVLVANLAALALNDLADVEDPQHVPAQISLVRYALGQFTRDEFVERLGRGVLEPIIWMNGNLPHNAKVLYIGEARAYYAKHPVIWSTAFDRPPLLTMSREARTRAGLLVALRQQGVTHVYMNSAELVRLQRGYGYMAEANWELIETVLQRATEIHRWGNRVVYELAE